LAYRQEGRAPTVYDPGDLSQSPINDKYGEFVITPALMMGMDDTIIDLIAFGGVKELEELYQQ
jgi:hypothetical protein